MFRDLKEYQEIQKLYSDKVSKPENLEERVRGGGVSSNPVKPFEKPMGSSAGSNNKRGASFRPNPINKPINSGASNKRAEMSIKKRDEVKKPEIKKIDPKQFDNRRIKKIDPKQFDNRREPSPEPAVSSTPVVSDKTKQGKTRTKAQMMAAKRIASGKTIADVKQSNQDSMRAKAKARFAAFKAKRAEKKLDKQRDSDDPDKKMNRGESYTPDAYDFVLEYLLSTEQAATIEEANYVMTEMDAETIQGIVEEQKKNLDEMDMMKMPVVNVLGGLAGAVGGTVAAAKYLGRKAGERAIKKDGEKSGKPGLIQKIQTATDAKNKAIKGM